MIAGMRAFLIAVCSIGVVLASGSTGRAQGLLAKPGVQHASVAASANPAAASAGSQVTLWADVTPNPSIHIYAEGAKDFTPVSLVLTPNAGITAGRPKYPKPEAASAPGATDAVPAYKQTFRIAMPVTIKSTAKPGDVVSIAGAVNYQACDDRLCYPVTAAPVAWKVTVK
jgi:hypothetical protein